jgi:hypothetical protein
VRASIGGVKKKEDGKFDRGHLLNIRAFSGGTWSHEGKYFTSYELNRDEWKNLTNMQ